MDTKLTIANATKQLVERTEFSAVTVTTIMKQTGVRRQTFYDHFRDKYDVLAWIYEHEISENTKCVQFANWGLTLRRVVQYFNDNRKFYKAVLAIDGQNAPVEVIHKHFMSVVCASMSAISRDEHLTTGQYSQFTRELLADGLMQELWRWIGAKQPRPVEVETDFLHAYIEDQINGMIQRQRQSSVA